MTALASTEDSVTTTPRAPRTPRATAETMAAKQRDISVSEFFAKNRHLLGFDNPRKALLTTIKEAVDNSLDACEEAGILPDITVVIEDLEDASKRRGDETAKAGAGAPPAGVGGGGGKKSKATQASRYRVTVVDNGPGIVRAQVENVFGRLLFGSKFHRLKMSRGQQGIGISAAGMYGLITTGKPMLIQTRPKKNKPAHHIELAMNTKTNRAEVTVDEETEDFPLARLRGLSPAVRDLAERGEFLSAADYPTGTSVTIELEGKYQRGRGSVDEFLELTAIANPHARITLVRPTRTVEDEDEPTLVRRGPQPAPVTGADGAATDAGSASAAPAAPAAPAVTEDLGDLVVFPRAVNDLPPETKEIQPHPRGVELGTLLQMLKDFQESTKKEGSATLYTFLQEKFCRVSATTASEFCQKIGVTSRTKVEDVEPAQAEALYKAFQEARLAPPPTDCLAPIGVQQLLKGMFKGVRAEFYAASSREADIYRGRPFLIEAAIAFGGELPADDSARVIRFANRVPLLFQQSACSSFKAVGETNWRNYDLQHPRNALPVGPLVIMIHMASVWVPFTSESKEAIADYDEIRKEMKLALMECGRKLGTYLRKRARMRRESQRRDVFERYIGEITKAIHAINGTDASRLYEALQTQAKRRTAIADAQLDDEGRTIKDEDPADQDGVIIVGPVAPPDGPASTAPTKDRAPAPGAAAPSKRRERGGKSAADDATIFQQSATERAMLEVASRSKGRSGDEADAKPAKGASSSGRRETPPAKPQPAAKATKPKMRLVNGKLVPVDEPGLF